MFNNIIYVIIVLVLFQLNYPAEGLFESPITSVSILLLIWLNFALYCKYRFSRIASLYTGPDTSAVQSRVSSAYQTVVTRLSVLSIVVFAVSLYLLNLKYWLLKIPGFNTFSILPGSTAVAIFFGFLATIWYYGYPAYRRFFSYPRGRWSYVGSQIKLNCPILFPWAVITVCYDLITALAWPSLRGIFETDGGQFVFFSLFLLLLVVFLPPLIKYWWGCSPLPENEKREGIVHFLREAGFQYRDILRWPLLEGRIMTAGVMGLFPRFRYILITDSLLNILSKEELNAVMAHEMGHIRYRHMLFYVLFLLGYTAISFGLFDIFFYAMAMQPGLFELLSSQQELQVGAFYSLLSAPIVLSLVLYFRYIMGFFMRNFERQADLYSVQLMASPEPTILSLEKIARFGGQSRHQPSWHHFSIAERVEFLWRCWREPELIKRHSRRLTLFLAAVFISIGTLGYGLNFFPFKSGIEDVFLTRVLNRQLRDSPGNIEIYKGLASIHHRRDNPAKAQWAYENILRLDPDDGLALNNLAWILATAEDKDLLDYSRALALAKRAVGIERSATFLDTLAEAYYVNGFLEEALQTIQEALANATEGEREYLTGQLRKFKRAQALSGSEGGRPRGSGVEGGPRSD